MPDRTWTCSAALVLCTGVAALLSEHLQCAQPFVDDAHLLFAAVTSAVVSWLLLRGLRPGSDNTGEELYLHTRRVSRAIYTLMYLLALVRMAFYLLDRDRAISGLQRLDSPVRSLDDFQFYVACCVIPLWVVRAVVLSLPKRIERSAPASCDTERPAEEAVSSNPQLRGVLRGHGHS